ncbi:hypothetical protein LB505_011681 [Fusarium chuoi]|nr:hypothetical protein LB505_011681 [Fusarium chuoi]
MQTEERVVGSVSGRTYIRYAQFGNAWLTGPLLILSIAIYQGTSVVSPLWLSWWQKNQYTTITEDAYMGGYAAFGAGQSLARHLHCSASGAPTSFTMHPCPRSFLPLSLSSTLHPKAVSRIDSVKMLMRWITWLARLCVCLSQPLSKSWAQSSSLASLYQLS